MATVQALMFVLETPVSNKSQKKLAVMKKNKNQDFVRADTDGTANDAVLKIKVTNDPTLTISAVRVYKQRGAKTGALVGDGIVEVQITIPIKDGQVFLFEVDFNRKPDAPFDLKYTMGEGKAAVKVQ